VPIHIALPRAINLGSRKAVPMAGLRAMLEDLGFTDVRSLLNSGNLVFKSKPTGPKLEALLEDAARRDLGLDTEFMVRTSQELKRIVSGNPFKKEAKADPGHLMVHFCKEAVPKTLKVSGRGREDYRVKGKNIYVAYPDGIGRSKFKMAVTSTARNWNTVLKLAKAVAEID
jgi:uncharacterized protein (DUF1697 family)